MAYFTKQEVREYAKLAAICTEQETPHHTSGIILTLQLNDYSSKLENIVRVQNNQQNFDVFLSHSFRDDELIFGIAKILEKMGQKVYIDWVVDKQLSRDSVTKETAETLRNRMKQSSKLLHLATDNASSSKWMPWELGYFDGLKPGKVAILPLVDFVDSSFQGQEYLGLYPALDKDNLERFLD